MGKYAANTSVSAEKSVMEIEQIVTRWGAEEFGFARNQQQAMVFFRVNDRQVRFTLPLPDRNSEDFTLTETGRQRSVSAATDAYEQAIKQRWRSLALVIKAKLVAVDDGVVTFEQEFGAYVVLPSGRTAGEYLTEAIDQAYATGEVPPLMQITSG